MCLCEFTCTHVLQSQQTHSHMYVSTHTPPRAEGDQTANPESDKRKTLSTGHSYSPLSTPDRELGVISQLKVTSNRKELP